VREVDVGRDVSRHQAQTVVRVGQLHTVTTAEDAGGGLEDGPAQPAHLRRVVEEAGAHDDVVAFTGLHDHAQQIGEAVLTVGVEAGDVSRVGEPERGLDPGLQGAARPEVDRVGDAERPRLVDLLGRVVGARVVHGDDPEARPDELGDHLSHDRRLVVDADDDGDVVPLRASRGHGAHGCPLPCRRRVVHPIPVLGTGVTAAVSGRGDGNGRWSAHRIDARSVPRRFPAPTGTVRPSHPSRPAAPIAPRGPTGTTDGDVASRDRPPVAARERRCNGRISGRCAPCGRSARRPAAGCRRRP
jgi:hypothetical protein